jgi:hypothetical protein
MKNSAKVKQFKLAQQLIGQQLPTNKDGHAGRALELLLETLGVTINKGAGADILAYGLEVKTRKETASSAQTVATMSIKDIINTPYKESNIYQKFQQQLRIKTNELDIIVSAEIYDFDQPQIQDLVEQGYEFARKQIITNNCIGYTSYVGHWGYFEQCHLPNCDAYSFRFSKQDMEDLESMAHSTFSTLFTYN